MDLGTAGRDCYVFENIHGNFNPLLFQLSGPMYKTCYIYKIFHRVQIVKLYSVKIFLSFMVFLNCVFSEFLNFRIGNRAWFLFQVSPVLNTILKRSDKNCEVKQFSSLLSPFEWALNWNFSAKSQEWSSKKHF